MVSEAQKKSLIEAACTVREKAYAPYSNYKVGAAILVKDGRVFTGVNVENASYGLSICAERTAVFRAVTEGAREILADTRDLSSCRYGRRRPTRFSRNPGEPVPPHLHA